MKQPMSASLTVGELKKELARWPDDARIDFGETVDGMPLKFSRFKAQNKTTLQVVLDADQDFFRAEPDGEAEGEIEELPPDDTKIDELEGEDPVIDEIDIGDDKIEELEDLKP